VERTFSPYGPGDRDTVFSWWDLTANLESEYADSHGMVTHLLSFGL
jgi:hypothetical protein